MAAYYNEIDPFAAQWLRNLIAAGHIAPGVVDERSIKDVAPEDLSGFVQCHFFAGIGVWSHALRLAGWPDDRPVWTGSCPCQPFSSAGARLGTADERHLWPDWFNLIRERRPSVIFGEQVEAAVNHGWLDLVQADLESEDYACGAVGMPAAGVGAPHIRQRLWFVGHTASIRQCGGNKNTYGFKPEMLGAGHESVFVGLANNNNNNKRREWDSRVGWDTQRGVEHASDAGELGHADDARLEGHGRYGLGDRPGVQRRDSAPAGFWSRADWLPCRDGKARPVESGTFPLAHGATARVGRLRAYGNAIVPQVAQALIEAYLSCN